MTLVAGKRHSLLMAGDDDEMFMTRSLNVSPKTTEQHLIVRSGKFEAYNNKRQRSKYYTVELITAGHKASCGLSTTTAELLLV